LGVLEEDEHDQYHNNKVGPTFDEITGRKILMEGGARSTLNVKVTKVIIKTSYTPSPLPTQHKATPILYSFKRKRMNL
jgi:hypothetical protein